MGDDDRNEGGPGECPGHSFTLEKLVLVEKPGRLFPGIGIEMVCEFCETPAYEPSRLETGR